MAVVGWFISEFSLSFIFVNSSHILHRHGDERKGCFISNFYSTFQWLYNVSFLYYCDVLVVLY